MKENTNIRFKAIRNIFHDFAEIVSHHKIESVLCLLGSIFACIIFRYGDGLSLTAWSIDFFDSFFRGGFSGFNELVSKNSWGAPHGVLSGFMLPSIILGIWNLPLLLIHYIFNTECVITAPMYIWSKMFLVLLVIATGYYCFKIVKQITNDVNRGVVAFFLICGSTTLTLVSVGYSGQDEIFYILLLVMGLYDIINERPNRALVFLAIACTLNPAVLIFAILIVISSCKKFLEMVWRIAVLFASVLITMIGTPTASDSGMYIDWYFNRTLIGIGNGAISCFAAVIIFVYLAQLFIKRKDKDEQNRFLFFSLALLSLAMCTFSWLHFYRFFTCIPFMILSLMIVKNENAVSGGLVGLCVFDYSKFIISCTDINCLNLGNTFSYVSDMIGYGRPVNQSLYEIICAKFPAFAGLIPLLCGVALLCGIWVLYVSYPKNNMELTAHIPPRIVLIIWTAGSLIFSLLVVFLISRVNIINTHIEGDGTLANAITENTYLEEYYKAKPASSISVSVRPVTWGRTYPEDQKVIFEIVDADTNNVVGSTECSPNSFVDNSLYTFNISGINLQGGKWYIFRFSTQNCGNNEENGIYFLCSYAGTSDLNSHYATYISNGETVATDFDYVSYIYSM